MSFRYFSIIHSLRRKFSLAFYHTIWRVTFKLLLCCVNMFLHKRKCHLGTYLKNTNVLLKIASLRTNENIMSWSQFWYLSTLPKLRPFRCRKWTNMVKDLSGCSYCCSERMYVVMNTSSRSHLRIWQWESWEKTEAVAEEEEEAVEWGRVRPPIHFDFHHFEAMQPQVQQQWIPSSSEKKWVLVY